MREFDPTPVEGSRRRTLELFARAARLLLWPFDRSPEALYELFTPENLLTETTAYLNLGYWKDATTLDAACEAMAELIAEAAEMACGDVVVDAGSGFGDQDLLWWRRFRPRKIIAFNPARRQVDHARCRVRAAGVAEDAIEYRLGSATDTRLAPESVDRVIALESAFHFRTRADFFAEAFRILRRGGRIATCDVVALPPTERGRYPYGGWLNDLSINRFPTRYLMRLPMENWYDRCEYGERLRQAGFVDVRVESIRAQVVPGFSRHYASRKQLAGRLQRQHWMFRLRRAVPDLFPDNDYVLAAARKP